jgi:diphthamide synthase (EF-2-diphthine--ammonia ligase)
MQYALSFSGGKDSTLALDRARRDGLDVAYLFNIFEGVSGRVRFHGTRAPLIAAQAASLGIPLLQDSTHPDDYEQVFLRVLDRLQAAVEPLWLTPGVELLREFVERGYSSRIVSIDLARTPADWLGRIIDHTFIEAVLAHPSIDPCGERGEYHSFVENGPLFQTPLQTTVGPHVEMEGHALLEQQLKADS